MTEERTRYSRAQVAVHWLTLLLLLVSFFSHEAMKAAWRALQQTGEASSSLGTALHVWVGVSILVLLGLRVWLRLVQGAPAAVTGPSMGPSMGSSMGSSMGESMWLRAITILAASVQGLLYLVSLLLPLSGILAWFFGVVDAAGVHEILFNAGWVLLLLHILGALYHQFVLKDNLIARMW